MNNTQTKTDLWENKKDRAFGWFKYLRDQICQGFEILEGEYSPHNSACFERKPWDRASLDQPNNSGSALNGGGEISIMRGRVFEKVGVNISCVHGQFSDQFAASIPGAKESDGQFWAAGISLVAHMQSPLVPAVHMNTRMIATSKSWFGGGADLTPMVPDDSDTADFHAALKNCCDRHDPAYHPKFKQWADEYFFLPHRNEARGVGGIFYDYLENDWDADFAFTQDVGKTFNDIYPAIVRRHMNKTWTEAQREHQLIRRGRPKKTVTAKSIAIRLAPEVEGYFRSLGKGWQSHINKVLKDYVAKNA